MFVVREAGGVKGQARAAGCEGPRWRGRAFTAFHLSMRALHVRGLSTAVPLAASHGCCGGCGTHLLSVRVPKRHLRHADDATMVESARARAGRRQKGAVQVPAAAGGRGCGLAMLGAEAPCRPLGETRCWWQGWRLEGALQPIRCDQHDKHPSPHFTLANRSLL